MPYKKLNRSSIQMAPLSLRKNKQEIARDHVDPKQPPRKLTPPEERLIEATVHRIRSARAADRPVMLTFGAHTIKNGLGPLLIQLIEKRWVTHLATNGAGIIHDWEFSYQGKSSEDVEEMVYQGHFGNWQETGFYLNLALNVGAYEGKGYGEAVGAFIEQEGLTIPSAKELKKIVRSNLERHPERSAPAAELLGIIKRFELPPGLLAVPHPFKPYSIQAAAYRSGVPFTGHPMIGHDIIYNHPMNHGASLGRVALRDFLTFAESVSRIENGVYLSVGSAIMSPMVFEKSFSMAQNLALQFGKRIQNHYILVVDLAPSDWDWSQGEPPETHPAYYLRYNKTFNRMGGTMRYLTMDNRDFLLALAHRLPEDAAG